MLIHRKHPYHVHIAVILYLIQTIVSPVKPQPIHKPDQARSTIAKNVTGLTNRGVDAIQDDMMSSLYTMFGGGNPRTTPEGVKLIEGDMAIPEQKDDASTMSHRKATPDSSVYWPNAEVIYTYHESITGPEMQVIEAAMQHWRQNTCLKFRPKTAGDYYFIRFRSDTQGCWSLVGRQADRAGQGQDVSIGQGCANLNVVVHEIGHVIGFYHEQSRSDRDQHIEIIWNNVLPGYALQFRKESDTNLNVPYDLTSTMQYPQWAFSREIFEKSTIVARNPAYQRFLSKNYPLSYRDRILANHLYQCVQSCPSNTCKNGGYLRLASQNSFGSTTGQCSCDCPPNFSGAQCENRIREDYYDPLPCGGIVTSEGKIETPDYPRRSSPGQSCMWDIRAPAGKIVSIRFDGFEFAPRFTKAGTKVINKCFNETVEIRLKSQNIYDGDNYCGTDLAPGTVLRSDGPRALIIITANEKMIGRGLSARIRFRGPNEQGEETEVDDDQKPDNARDPSTTSQPVYTSQPDYTPQPTLDPVTVTQPPILPDVQTLPPIVPPQPPTIVTSSSLLEEYERESKKTLPPVFPY